MPAIGSRHSQSSSRCSRPKRDTERLPSFRAFSGFATQPMGLLQSEGQHGRYRLTPRAVEQGLGKRIDKSRNSKWPFDVISPEGQRLIAMAWDETVTDLERERLSDPIVHTADAVLQRFKLQRASVLETQQEVCWLLDHFDGLTFQQITDLLGVQRPLVSRYANLRKEQREFHSRRIASV
jgi:hypothetical protein